MDRAVMAGRGPIGAGVLVLSILIIFSTRSSRAQKGDGCGQTVLGPTSGTLSSLGYPGTYPNGTVCEWEISVPQGRRVHFLFADLDIEDSNCQVNYLRLYNGVGSQRNEIVKYCGLGLKVKELIESTGNQVTVQFMSGTHRTGRGFYLSYSTTEHTDLITCLDKGADFAEAEFTKYCPAGCLTSVEEISGTIPNGYRETSPLCVAAIHAGVVSNAVGGQISVVISKGIPHYDGTLANNVTSTGGTLSNSLFTFKTSGCYGTLGLESVGVADGQLSASSRWEWSSTGQQAVWGPPGARLKKEGLPWAAAHNDLQQWLQVDLKREKRVTGITTTGSTLWEYQFYVSAYRVLHSNDALHWDPYRELNSTQEKIFQGNANYLQEVRNNFIPPIEARYVRINPIRWHQRIALKLELLGCQSNAARPRTFHHPDHLPHPPAATYAPPRNGRTTPSPDIRNTTMPPRAGKGVVLAAVLVPALVTALTLLLLTVVCTLHWRNRNKSSDGTYDLPQWDRSDWWRSMKQLLPSKMAERDSSARYCSSEVGRLRGRVAIPLPAEYAQPLVSGAVTSLGPRSTFKPEDSDPELYDAPIPPDVYHAYAEPLPASGAEYATPIVIDMGCHLSGGFQGNGGGGSGPTPGLPRADGGTASGNSPYDTPKSANEQATPTEEEMTYQVPQSGSQKPTGGL